MDVKKASYFADFIACPTVAAGLLAIAARQPDSQLPALAGGIAGGIAAWTLVEYAIHRVVYHHAPVIRDLHDVHHRDPRSYEGTPPFLSVVLILLFVYEPLTRFGTELAAGGAVGMLLGYEFYMIVHHAVHHVNPRPGGLLYKLWKLHARHHYARAQGNYGVTSNVWDLVFGTALDR